MHNHFFWCYALVVFADFRFYPTLYTVVNEFCSDVNEATTPRGRGRDPRGWGRGQDPRGLDPRGEAKAEARIFGLEAEAEFEAKFMRRQKYEKPKNL